MLAHGLSNEHPRHRDGEWPSDPESFKTKEDSSSHPRIHLGRSLPGLYKDSAQSCGLNYRGGDKRGRITVISSLLVSAAIKIDFLCRDLSLLRRSC